VASYAEMLLDCHHVPSLLVCLSCTSVHGKLTNDLDAGAEASSQ